MPDFHQPDADPTSVPPAPADLAETTGDWASRVPLDQLREHAAAAGIAGAETLGRDELVAALHTAKPSNRHEPGGHAGT